MQQERREIGTKKKILIVVLGIEAIAAFEVVIEIDPRNAEAYLDLAETYEATQKEGRHTH